MRWAESRRTYESKIIVIIVKAVVVVVPPAKDILHARGRHYKNGPDGFVANSVTQSLSFFLDSGELLPIAIVIMMVVQCTKKQISKKEKKRVLWKQVTIRRNIYSGWCVYVFLLPHPQQHRKTNVNVIHPSIFFTFLSPFPSVHTFSIISSSILHDFH